MMSRPASAESDPALLRRLLEESGSFSSDTGSEGPVRPWSGSGSLSGSRSSYFSPRPARPVQPLRGINLHSLVAARRAGGAWRSKVRPRFPALDALSPQDKQVVVDSAEQEVKRLLNEASQSVATATGGASWRSGPEATIYQAQAALRDVQRKSPNEKVVTLDQTIRSIERISDSRLVYVKKGLERVRQNLEDGAETRQYVPVRAPQPAAPAANFGDMFGF